MDIQLVPLEQFQAFLISTARVAGFIGAMPVFSGPQAPPQVRVALVFSCSLVLFPLMQGYIPDLSQLRQPLSPC